jgi:hypothetical protein
MPTFLTIWRRSLCAVSGAIAGGIVGLLVGLFQAAMPGVIPLADVIRAALILGLFAWLVILLIVGVWLHYGVGAIALSSLVTTFLTSLLTVYLANKIQLPVLATWIGILVGTLVGYALCRLCGEPKYAVGRAQL